MNRLQRGWLIVFQGPDGKWHHTIGGRTREEAATRLGDMRADQNGWPHIAAIVRFPRRSLRINSFFPIRDICHAVAPFGRRFFRWFHGKAST